MILVTLAAGACILLPPALKDLGGQAWSAAAFGANLCFWRNVAYFAGTADDKALLHTWSLSVEEQFYLVLPLVLTLAWRVFPTRQRLLVVLGVGSTGAFALNLLLTHLQPTASFFLTPPRSWELLIGACVALAKPSRIWTRTKSEAITLLSLVAIVAPASLYPRSTAFPGFWALAPCFGAALLLWVSASTSSSVSRGLSWRPLGFVGRISYSLYHWHWPILVFVRYLLNRPVDAQIAVACVASSVVVGIASWRWIEEPFRHGMLLGSRRRALAFAGISCLLVTGAAVVCRTHEGLEGRFSPQVARLARAEGELQRFPKSLRARDVDQRNVYELSGLPGGGRPDLLLWGDSHAMAVIPAIKLVSQSNGWRGMAAVRASTAPLLSGDQPRRAREFNQATLRFIRTNAVRRVLLVSRWSSAYRGRGEKGFRESLIETVAELKQTGVDAIFMREVPDQSFMFPELLAFAASKPGTPPPPGISLVEHSSKASVESELVPILRRLGVKVVDPLEVLANVGGQTLIQSQGESPYVAAHHLSRSGAELLTPLFNTALSMSSEPESLVP